ncbi:MAG TPA: autoinducer binding domain-containing protein [Albitalea sp.]|uniref:helix-turn-helix transcriptional regulator n=1 Tax=Piscinibacter sp. TaxID=1903157 RepID=UPI002ECFC0C5
MLLKDYASILSVKDLEGLRREVVTFTRQLGFEIVAAIAATEQRDGSIEFLCVDNTPAAFRHVFDDCSTWVHDPVMQHCRRASFPIVWNQQTYVAAGQGEKWEMQAPYGYRAGIALASHLANGRHFCIGIDRDQALPTDVRELTRMVAELQLFAAHVQDIALPMLLPAPRTPEPPALTPRELECLRWTMEGKTAWELGCILGISEQTAARHIHNATHKLGCVNKLQAVLAALRIGLIH